jgi:hypothetical protein
MARAARLLPVCRVETGEGSEVRVDTTHFRGGGRPGNPLPAMCASTPWGTAVQNANRVRRLNGLEFGI